MYWKTAKTIGKTIYLLDIFLDKFDETLSDIDQYSKWNYINHRKLSSAMQQNLAEMITNKATGDQFALLQFTWAIE